MIVNNNATLQMLLAAVKDSKRLAIDTETNFTDQNHDRFLVGVSICTDKYETFYIPTGHQAIPEMELFAQSRELNYVTGFAEFFTLLVRGTHKPLLIFHNAKFDLQILEQSGVVLWENFEIVCTLLMSHLVNENPPHGLKPLAKMHLGYQEAPTLQRQIKSLAVGYGWECVHPMAMSIYAEQDALLTMKLYEFLLPKIEEQELSSVLDTDIKFMNFLRQIEGTGVLLDRELARQRSKESAIRMEEIQHEVGFAPSKVRLVAEKLYGTPPHGLGLTPSSYTPNGQIQVNEAVLARINHPFAGLVLEYRGLLKAKSTWFDGFLEKADLAGRLHPNFKQTGTVTGRLSCENPNLQQIPREGNRVKDLFIADSGYELWEFDFSQIELRLAAVYGNEDELLTAFREGRDIHQSIADNLNISRYAAKTLVYASLYGAGVNKIAEQLGVNFIVSRNYLDNYHATYPGLARVSEYATSVAERNTWVKFWTGRKRHFKYPSEHHKAFNSIIQGGAAAIVKQAGLNIQNYRVVNCVHDSYWLELPKPVNPQDIKTICKLMSEWTIEKFELEFTVNAGRLN